MKKPTIAVATLVSFVLIACGGGSDNPGPMQAEWTPEGGDSPVSPGWTPEGLTRDEVVDVLGEPEAVTHEDALLDQYGDEMMPATDTLIWPDGSEVEVDAETGAVTFWATFTGWDVAG